MTNWLRRKLRRFHGDRRGAAFLYMTVCLPVIFAMASFSLDLGYMLYIKNRLQTAADLGALAGAKLLYTNSNPIVAKDRAISVVWKNLPTQWNGLNAPVTTQVDAAYDCKGTAPFSSADCGYAASGKNAIRVTATATAPMFFASFFGMKTKTFQATSVAGGGNTPALNVVVIVDTTSSMGSTKCSTNTSVSKLECAKSGVMSLLSGLQPTSATVSLMIYPGLNKSAADWATNPKWLNYITCNPNGILTKPTSTTYSSNTGGVQWYGGTGNYAPLYSIVSNSVDYKSNGTINTNSLLVKAAGGGTLPAGKTKASDYDCTNSTSQQRGLQAKGGAGTYFAPVLQAAWDALTAANGSSTQRQSVIIILSDGNADASTNLPSKLVSTGVAGKALCTDAVNVAKNAAKSTGASGKVWVYSIAYDAQNSGCPNDTINACTTMKNMASDASKFYSNSATCDAGKNTNADLSLIFKDIALSLMRTRRVTEASFIP